MRFDNRVTRLLGVEIPIVQAPMGWIARSQLASAVSRAGALGIIETSSGELDAVRGEIRRMRELTDRPFGVNIAQAFVRDPGIVDFVVEQGVRFVTTSAGDPTRYTRALKDAGLTVFHVVPTLRAAQKAVDAGRRRPGGRGRRGRRLQEPAPGLDHGAAAARALEASTCRSSPRAASATAPRWRPPSRSAPRACRWARAWSRPPSRRCTTTGSTRSSRRAETGTVFLRAAKGPALRALRTERTERLERGEGDPMAELGAGVRGGVLRRRPRGRRRALRPGGGAHRGVEPVAEIIARTVREFFETVERLGKSYPAR